MEDKPQRRWSDPPLSEEPKVTFRTFSLHRRRDDPPPPIRKKENSDMERAKGIPDPQPERPLTSMDAFVEQASDLAANAHQTRVMIQERIDQLCGTRGDQPEEAKATVEPVGRIDVGQAALSKVSNDLELLRDLIQKI